MDTLQRIKSLITLAHSDGELSETERRHIIALGQANHLLVAEILPLFQIKDTGTVSMTMAEDQKADFLLELVQLMKIDQRIYKAELKYCAGFAARLGYKEEVLLELMVQTNQVNRDPDQVKGIRKLMEEYKIGK